MTKQNKSVEQFIRWQGITIKQLSYSINLFLTFSLTTIGFGISLMLKDSCQSTFWQLVIRSVSLLFLLISGALGIMCTMNRLKDFRETKETTKLKFTKGNQLKIAKSRLNTKRLGKKTWCLFRGQIHTFWLGILLLVVSVTYTVFIKTLR